MRIFIRDVSVDCLLQMKLPAITMRYLIIILPFICVGGIKIITADQLERPLIDIRHKKINIGIDVKKHKKYYPIEPDVIDLGYVKDKLAIDEIRRDARTLDHYFIGTPGLSVTIDENAPGHFTYHDQDAWPVNFPTCGGMRQTPIDIITKNTRNITRLTCLKWNNYKKNHKFLVFKNDGYTIDASCTWANGLIPTIEGGILSGAYRLEGIHWHWGPNNANGSEHLKNGQSTPLEMHLVHRNVKFRTLGEALKSREPEALVVVGFFFKINYITNLGMYMLVNSMTSATGLGVQNRIFPLGYLGVTFKDGYYTYLGSLTTPPCLEIVRWIIPTKTIKITPRQLLVFRNIMVNDRPLTTNYRRIQNLNGRRVGYVTGCAG